MTAGFPSRATWLVAAFSMVLATFSLDRAVHADNRQVTHHLRVTLDPASGRLQGLDTLMLPALDEPRLVAILAPSARILSVKVGDDPVPPRFTDGHLEIPVSESSMSRPLRVAIAYEAELRDRAPSSPLNTEDPTYGVTGTISPEGVFLLADAGWYPDLPGFDARFQVEIETPEAFHAVTAGRRIDERVSSGKRVVTWRTEHPVRGLALSAAPYVVQSLEGSRIPISTYFLPESTPLSDTYLKAASEYLDLYAGLFGAYPFSKFSIVENFFPTGYGFPSYTLLGSTVIRLPFITRTSLGHEVAHSWWGNCVFVDPSRGNWSEGLVTYLADHFYQERESQEAARHYRMQILRNFATLVHEPEDFPLRSFLGRTSPASRSIGYGKGAMIFHMVRCLIGEEAFWDGLRDVFQARRFQEASWSDFAEKFGKRAHRDLGPFFSQWVDRPGAPWINLETVSTREERGRWIVNGTLRQSHPYYDLEVPIQIEDQTGGTTRHTVHLNESTRPFTVATSSAPVRLSVDRDVSFFRRLAPSEIPADINMLRSSRSLVVVLARGAPREWREALATLLAGLGRPETPVIEEDRYAPASYLDNDVLFCGLPESEGLLPTVPQGLTVRRDGFEWDGRRFAGPSDSLFAVLPRSNGVGRLTALFLPLSPNGASTVARKIPHYGTYSLLIFEAGTNVVKKTWPVTDSPLIHQLAGTPSP
ncbi:MAG: M1 family metallopeptidase [Syntrophobacteraceae bacterium]